MPRHTEDEQLRRVIRQNQDRARAVRQGPTRAQAPLGRTAGLGASQDSRTPGRVSEPASPARGASNPNTRLGGAVNTARNTANNVSSAASRSPGLLRRGVGLLGRLGTAGLAVSGVQAFDDALPEDTPRGADRTRNLIQGAGAGFTGAPNEGADVPEPEDVAVEPSTGLGRFVSGLGQRNRAPAPEEVAEDTVQQDLQDTDEVLIGEAGSGTDLQTVDVPRRTGLARNVRTGRTMEFDARDQETQPAEQQQTDPGFNAQNDPLGFGSIATGVAGRRRGLRREQEARNAATAQAEARQQQFDNQLALLELDSESGQQLLEQEGARAELVQTYNEDPELQRVSARDLAEGRDTVAASLAEQRISENIESNANSIFNIILGSLAPGGRRSILERIDEGSIQLPELLNDVVITQDGDIYTSNGQRAGTVSQLDAFEQELLSRSVPIVTEEQATSLRRR